MYTTVDAEAGAPRLRFTAHAQVRFLERYVDQPSVRQARRSLREDAAILSELGPRYAKELEEFRRTVGEAARQWKARAGSLPFESYRLAVGKCRVAVVSGTCVTTLPARRPHPRRGIRDID